MSRQQQLAYAVRDDSSIGSTAPPSEPMSDFRLTRHGSADVQHSGGASGHLSGARGAMTRISLRASACEQYRISEIREEEGLESGQALPSGTAVLGHTDAEEEAIDPAVINLSDSERLSEMAAALSAAAAAGGTTRLGLRHGLAAPVIGRPRGSGSSLLGSMGPGVALLDRPKAQTRNASGSLAKPGYIPSTSTSANLPAVDSCSPPTTGLKVDAKLCTASGQPLAFIGHQSSSSLNPSAMQNPGANLQLNVGATHPQHVVIGQSTNQRRNSTSVDPSSIAPTQASGPFANVGAAVQRFKRSGTLEKLSRMLARPSYTSQQGFALQDVLQLDAPALRYGAVKTLGAMPHHHSDHD